jgi:putative RecB family exonuclease
MRAPDHISVSQINLYRTCSLKYRFQYIDELPRLVRPAALLFGSAVHAALKWLHQARQAGAEPRLEDLLRIFEADWHAQCLDADILFPTGTPADQLLVKGKELLSAYFHTPARPVQDAELAFQVPLVDPTTGEVLDVPLRGVMDLVEADGTLIEFKTSQRRWAVSDLPDNVQLTAYSYAYALLFGRPPTALHLVNLIRTRNPVIETHTTARDTRDYERLFHLGKEVRRGIRAGVFIPNRGCWLCKDCEYERDCHEWSGNEDRQEGAAWD